MRASIKLLFIAIVFASEIRHNYANLSINMPVERSVFQRVNNKANIQIGGHSSVFLHQIQVKLEVINGGISRDWSNVNTNVNPGNFRCQLMDVDAGWYKLLVKGIVNGNEVGFDTVEKVGVGEVFIIAGQSNAQGGRFPHPSFSTQVYYGANDDRVNGINHYSSHHEHHFPLPIIEKIAPITDLAPKGRASWCWGSLGDKIATDWNVPVIFFNAAVGATTASDWSNSANNNTQPYAFLRKTLKYYAKIFGVRAILWHQGESDGIYFDQNMPHSYTNYVQNMLNVINHSRADLGANVSWVVARVARLGDWWSQNLINCQEYISTIPDLNCFTGPYTDDIQPDKNDRDGWAHFRAEGLLQLADVWHNSLNNANFINNSNPISATNNLKIEHHNFEFGNSLAPCFGQNETVKSGSWTDPSTWSCGVQPITLNEIVVNAGHSISVNNATIYIKNLVLNGALNIENDGNIIKSDF